ncbi:MAG: hypothetical protein MHM6MM_001508 [Cercozoa sp. M6MM]
MLLRSFRQSRFGLRCAARVIVEGGVKLDETAVSTRAMRSSGPGGQHVNTTNSKVEARFNLYAAWWLPEKLRERFLAIHSNRITSEGDVIVRCQDSRSQEQNRKLALKRLQQLLDEANELPPERIETAPPAYAKERRLKDKRKRSDVKSARKGKGGRLML